MYRLFIKPIANLGRVNTPNIDNIRGLIRDHYTYQQEQYQDYGTYVSEHHMLVKLAYAVTHYLETEMDTYRIVQENIHQTCSVLGITSETTFGHVHANAFYTDTCIILSATYEKPFEITDWREIRAVRCLTYQDTAMELHVPPMKRADLKKGLAVVGIDIPLYALQLKKWVAFNQTLPIEEQQTVMQFIGRYVLPGMVKEQLDISLRNRLIYIASDTEVPSTGKERSFVTSYEDRLSKTMGKTINVLNRSREPYLKSLQSVPLVWAESYLDGVPLAGRSLSSYSYWASIMLFTDWMYPLTQWLEPDNNSKVNIEKVLYRVNRYLNSTGSLKKIPQVMREDFEMKFDVINKTYG